MSNKSLSNSTPNSVQVKMLKGSLKNIPLPPDIFVANKPSVSLYTVFLFRLIFSDWVGNNKDN